MVSASVHRAARWILAAVAWVTLGFGLPGCASVTPRTEVLVVIDTDLRGAGGIDNLYVEVLGPTGERQTSTARLGSGEAPLPRSVGLIWDGAGPLGPFTVRVVGNTGGAQRAERIAVFAFQRNRTLVLPIALLARCERVTCGASMTCGENGCRSITVDPSELLPWTGTLPGLDGSVFSPDGGIDASERDAGERDAGDRDAGDRDDGGAPSDASADGGTVPDSCVTTAESCNGLDDDCDGTADEDFDRDADAANCGACGHACALANATGGCVGGACVITVCDAGFDDCNAAGDDGCEVDLARDPAHCGSCAVACDTGRDRTCCASACARTCP